MFAVGGGGDPKPFQPGCSLKNLWMLAWLISSCTDEITTIGSFLAGCVPLFPRLKRLILYWLPLARKCHYVLEQHGDFRCKVEYSAKYDVHGRSFLWRCCIYIYCSNDYVEKLHTHILRSEIEFHCSWRYINLIKKFASLSLYWIKLSHGVTLKVNTSETWKTK